MNLNDFITKYQGTHVEVAGSANAVNQCTDLANAYIREVLGKPIIEWTDAKDFPSKVNPNDYDFIPNPKNTVPSVGDIVVWSTNHIAICTYSDVNLPWFTSFDQNWPTGSVCHSVDHSYTNVSGWLHPKPVVTPEDQIKEEYQKEIDAKNVQIGNLQGQVNGLIEDNKKLSSDLGTANSEKQAMVNKIESQNNIIGEFQKEDAIQISDLKTAQDERLFYKNLLEMTLWDWEDELKLNHPSDDLDARLSKVTQALISLKESKTIVTGLSDYRNIIKLFGNLIYRR